MTTERITKGPEDNRDPGSEALAAVLRGCVSCGLLLADPDHSVKILNREAEDVLKLSAHSTYPLSTLPEALRTFILNSLEKQAPAQAFTVLKAASGEAIEVGLWAAPATAPQGTVVVALNRFLAVGPIEPDLQRLDRLANTGMLSAGLAHEIKNALVPVKTFTDLLLEKDPGAELAGIVRKELARVDALVGRLLKFARPPGPTSTPIRLHETLDYALRLVQHYLPPGSIRLERVFSARFDMVRGDEGQLHQAFINFLMNGIEAMGPAGVLTVRTENVAGQGADAAKDLLRVSIRDTGPGIPTENLARLFEPFFTTKTNGTGLGLAVAQRILAEHKATISVESRRDEGAVFKITLPLFEPQNPGDLTQ